MITRTFNLWRFPDNEWGTFGLLCHGHDLIVHTLEPRWRDNAATGIAETASCIPSGDYEVVFEYSPKFGTSLYEVKGIQGRTETKFHWGNTWRDTVGCQLVGRGAVKRGLSESRLAYEDLHARAKGEGFLLKIRYITATLTPEEGDRTNAA